MVWIIFGDLKRPHDQTYAQRVKKNAVTSFFPRYESRTIDTSQSGGPSCAKCCDGRVLPISCGEREPMWLGSAPVPRKDQEPAMTGVCPLVTQCLYNSLYNSLLGSVVPVISGYIYIYMYITIVIRGYIPTDGVNDHGTNLIHFVLSCTPSFFFFNSMPD